MGEPKISSAVANTWENPKYLLLLLGYMGEPKISSAVARIHGRTQNIF
jgi:hypothetical protein